MWTMRYFLCALGLALFLEHAPVKSFLLRQPEEDDTTDDDSDADSMEVADQAAEEAAMNVGPNPPTAVEASVQPPPSVPVVAVAIQHAALPWKASNKVGEPAQPAVPSAVHLSSSKVTDAAVDAQNAHTAAVTAKKAAKVANKVAKHSVHVTEHAKSALKDARNALHVARVDTAGLSAGQKESLRTAEAKLKEATMHAEYGEVKQAKYIKSEAENKKLQNMEHSMEKVKTQNTGVSELEAMRIEIKELRARLAAKGGDKDIDAALAELEEEIAQLEKGETANTRSHDEMKAEIEHLRELIDQMPDPTTTTPLEYRADLRPMPQESREEQSEPPVSEEVTPVETKGIDIDTAMPYGDLEPFGREDTAQELTESSIKESDEMVDQLERAEVAEEKRAVFRALTRLRGAAITSFDGVARSQTGNIDEYNKIHKWRNNHPLHHLADEESDVSKWAFPDNAD